MSVAGGPSPRPIWDMHCLVHQHKTPNVISVVFDCLQNKACCSVQRGKSVSLHVSLDACVFTGLIVILGLPAGQRAYSCSSLLPLSELLQDSLVHVLHVSEQTDVSFRCIYKHWSVCRVGSQGHSTCAPPY